MIEYVEIAGKSYYTYICSLFYEQRLKLEAVISKWIVMDQARRY